MERIPDSHTDPRDDTMTSSFWGPETAVESSELVIAVVKKFISELLLILRGLWIEMSACCYVEPAVAA
jgi:hypothetical protein